jgi:membrane protein DedA with SNARE-associated domain
MVSLAYFVGQVVPLPQLVSWVGEFAIIALLLVVAWFVIPMWWESRQAKNI